MSTKKIFFSYLTGLAKLVAFCGKNTSFYCKNYWILMNTQGNVENCNSLNYWEIYVTVVQCWSGKSKQKNSYTITETRFVRVSKLYIIHSFQGHYICNSKLWYRFQNTIQLKFWAFWKLELQGWPVSARAEVSDQFFFDSTILRMNSFEILKQ